MTLTAELLRERYNYDTETGKLTVKTKYANCVKIGDEVGARHWSGGHNVTIHQKTYTLHRVIWMHVYGVWPEKQIDHINGDRSDNRLSNLRLATHSENQRNKRAPKTNTSGFKGVCFNKKSKKWQAGIRVGGSPIHLGLFDSAEAAASAYAAAAQNLHGEYARLQ